MTDTNPQPSVEERVARHLASKDWLTTPDRWDTASAWFRADYLAFAREVIALVQPDAPASTPTDRAAILREAADHLETLDPVEAALAGQHAWADAAAELRRRADAASGPGGVAGETQQAETKAEPEFCGAEPLDTGWVGDCWCTLPPGHSGDHQCQPCTDRHGAPGWTEQTAAVSQPDGEA
jgi:hypothetical protein